MKKSKIVNIIISPGGGVVGDNGASVVVYEGDDRVAGVETEPTNSARLPDQLGMLTKEYVQRYFLKSYLIKRGLDKNKKSSDWSKRVRRWNFL